MADVNVRIVKNNGKKPIIKSFPKTASTALSKNSLVEITSGKLAACDDNETTVLGILLEEVAATDDDYASTTKKQVEIIQSGDEVEMDTTAELTVGAAYGISNAYTVDQSDTTNKVFLCTAVISSTRARGIMETYFSAPETL
jgi:ribosomal protein L15